MRRPVLLLWACAALVHAQGPEYDVHPDYLVERYTVEDGLPSNIVHALALQPGGYLWLATADGLARFDGLAFTVYDGANAGLRTSRILAVSIDTTAGSPDGPVWFAAGEDDLYRLQDGVISSLKDDPAITGSLPSVVSFAGDSTWIRTLDGVWVLSRGEVRRRWKRLLAPGTTAAGALFAVWRQPDGETWLVQPQGVVHLRQGQARRYPFPDGWSSNYSLLDADGTLWLSLLQGLARFRDGRYELVVPGADVGALAITPDGRRWVIRPHTGTWSRFDDTGVLWPAVDAPGGGLSTTVVAGPDGAAWFVQGDWLYRETTPVLRLATSAGAAVPFIVGDEGDVWVGGAHGLVHVRRRVVSVVSAEEGLGGRNVYPVLAARDGSVWAGLWYEGPHLTRLVDARPVESYTLPGVSAVTSLMEDRRGALWIGTDARLFRMEAGRPRQVMSTAELCNNATPFIDALMEDRRGRIWAGGHNRLIRGEPTTSGWRWTCEQVDGARFLAFVETRAGEILAATGGGGLGRMTQAGRFEWLRAADGLASDNVRDVFEDERGVLWIATEDRGLCRLDRRGQPSLRAGTLACLSEADGLLDNSLHRVIPDDDGRLWINSNAGIFALDRADADAVAAGTARSLTVQAFTEADGLRNREGNGGHQPAGSRASDGRLYLPTQDGVAVVDPASIRPPTAPVARVEGITVGNREVPEAEWRATGLTMAPGERDLRVRYTGIAFSDAEAVRFRVRLAGYDDAWREVGAARSEGLTNLPPGDYTVEVQAGRGGAWSEPARLAIVRRPFLWETSWFRVLALLAVAGLVALAVRARLRGLARRQRELEATVETRTAELRRANEVKTRFLQNVSHELRTPLALLLGPVRDLRSGRFSVDERARPLLDRAAANGGRLQRLIDDLLTLSRLDGDAIGLQRRRLDLADFVRLRVAAFGSRAESAGVALALDVPEAPVVVAADPGTLETVLYNLVGNALKFTPDGGRVTVRVEPDGDGARVEVEDTGIGIATGDVPHLFDRFFQADTEASRIGEGAGIGLALTRELVELHGGTISASSALGVGTTVTVRLPAGTADVETEAGRLDAPTPLPEVPAYHGDGASGPAPMDDDDRLLVLVVEDNADLRVYLRTVLGDRYRIEEAADGAGGLSCALDLVPDVVVSDVMMPGLDGFALLAALKADVRTSHVPVLLLTARADVESRLAGLGAGADAYLAKPFDAAELEASVASLIANRRRLRDAWAAGRAVAPEGGEEALPDGLAPAEAEFLERLDGVVRRHLQTADFGADALADALGLSLRQLYRKLAALTDETPGTYIRRVRLERSAELLAEGERSVKEVGWEVGFKSASGFREAFREAYGIAPTQYRKP